MSANCSVVGTSRTRTSPVATRSWTKVDLHVLRTLMLHEIGGEVDRVDVVVVDECGALEGAMELLEKLAQLRGLCDVVGHRAILGLCAGVRDDGLPIGGLGDKVGTQEHVIAESGPACVGAASPVSIDVAHKLRRWG
jgi:hypothetical protein